MKNIALTFREGKIVEATCNDTQRINQVFDRDAGARYVGEFAIGVNPYITFPMKDTLSTRRSPAASISPRVPATTNAATATNPPSTGDLVCIQTPEMGGGEMYFDGVFDP